MVRGLCVSLCLSGFLLGGCATSGERKPEPRSGVVSLTERSEVAGEQRLVIVNAAEELHETQDTADRCWAAASVIAMKAEAYASGATWEIPSQARVESLHQIDLEQVLGRDVLLAIAGLSGADAEGASFRPSDAAAWMEVRDALAPEYLERMDARLVMAVDEFMGPQMSISEIRESLERGEPVLAGLRDADGAMSGHVWVVVGMDFDAASQPLRVLALDPRDTDESNDGAGPILHEWDLINFEPRLAFAMNRTESVEAFESDLKWLRQQEIRNAGVYVRSTRAIPDVLGEVPLFGGSRKATKPVYKQEFEGNRAEIIRDLIELRLAERRVVYPFRY
ncbi:MAG: papain-like cysteine protease family protein [Planctomycetota bacterium]